MWVLVDEQCGDVGKRQNRPEGRTEGHREVKFTVYGNPVQKDRPRVVNGHAFTTRKTSDHEEIIALVYKSVYHDFMFEKDAPLRMVMDFYLEIPKSATKKKRKLMMDGKIRVIKRPDVDNLQKCVADALNGVAYFDDAQIVEMVGRKHYSSRARTDVYIVVAADDE